MSAPLNSSFHAHYFRSVSPCLQTRGCYARSKGKQEESRAVVEEAEEEEMEEGRGGVKRRSFIYSHLLHHGAVITCYLPRRSVRLAEMSFAPLQRVTPLKNYRSATLVPVT